MKKLLAFFAVATMSVGASAADKGTEFKFGGEIKQMFNWNNNPTFANSNATTEENWLQKNQVHINAVSSDRLQAYFNLVHSAIWGAGGYNGTNTAYSTTVTGGANAGNALVANSLTVGEAWMWWKASDSLSLRPGRQSVTFGDGFVASKNDDLPMPYYFDGLMARWSWDFMDLDFGGAKLADAGLASSTDTEIVMYGANFGFKTLPDVLKKFDVFVINENGDALTGATASGAPMLAVPGVTGFGAWNIMTYGLFGKLDFSMIDLKLNAAFQSGKQKAVTAGASDVTFNGNAFDVELGVNFPEFMKGRLYVGYHQDTGDDTTSAATNEGYQPLFYDVNKYSVAGIWGMGNLTNISLGLTLNPTEESSYGIDANMASRTSDKAGATLIPGAYGNSFTAPATGTGTDKALATTVGIWGNHTYGHGLATYIGLNYIMPGNYYKPAGASIGNGIAANFKATYSF